MGPVFIDHYLVLGLPPGEEGAKISEKEITKAYRTKALELHPDEPDFQNLQVSYHILKDEITRKAFDDEVVRRRLTLQKRADELLRRRLTQQKCRRECCTSSSMMSSVEERKCKRRMSYLDEKVFSDHMLSELHDEESKRRMMADLEEHWIVEQCLMNEKHRE